MYVIKAYCSPKIFNYDDLEQLDGATDLLILDITATTWRYLGFACSLKLRCASRGEGDQRDSFFSPRKFSAPLYYRILDPPAPLSRGVYRGENGITCL